MNWIQFGLLLSGINLTAFGILLKSKGMLVFNAIAWFLFSVSYLLIN